MPTDPQHVFHTQTIHFDNGNVARALLAPCNANAYAILAALDLQKPSALVAIMGGAGQLTPQLAIRLTPLFTHGIAHVAKATGAIIIDGGTQSGVMELMGQGVARHGFASALLGVSPAALVTYPSQSVSDDTSDHTLLDPNHSHFVLVQTNQWGGETHIMYKLVSALAQDCPSVAILVNGGNIARDEVLYNVRHSRPLIIIEGSGRLADELVARRRGASLPPPDAITSEILSGKHIHIFPSHGSTEDFISLVTRFLR